MPPRKKLAEEELEEIRNLRGQMSAKDIQKKYGIGAPRLYKIWRESTRPTIKEDAAEPTRTDISQQNTDRILPDKLDIPVQSNAGEQHASYLQNQLLFQIQNTLQNIDTTLQNIGDRIIETQEEVESVASDVEDIDEKVDDLEADASTMTDLSKKIYEATKTVEKMIYYGAAALSILSVLATTLKFVRRAKDKDSFEEEPKSFETTPSVEEPKQKPTTTTDPFFGSPMDEPEDPFAM